MTSSATWRSNRRAIRTAVAAVSLYGAFALLPRHAVAADGIWIAPSTATDVHWETASNWQDNIIPGSTDGLAGTNTDTATIITGGSGSTIPNTELIPDAGRNIKNIIFNIASGTNGREIGQTSVASTLYLTGGGSTIVSATPTSSQINSSLVILGNSYTFRDDIVGQNAGGLKLFGSTIKGGTAGNLAITLDGAAWGSSVLTSNCQIPAQFTDGSATHLSIIKNGSGVWDLRNTSSATPNDYTGDTTLNSGAIRFNGLYAMSPNSNYIVSDGAAVRFSVAGMVGKSLKVIGNTGTNYAAVTQPPVSANNDGTITSFKNESGPALVLDMSSATGTISFGAGIKLTGTTALQGGVQLISSNTTPKVTWSKTIDLGSVARVFEVPHSTANDTTGDPDLQISNPITSTGAAALVKTGTGVLKLNDPANSFTGQLEVQQGSIRFNGNNSLTGVPTVLIDGGDFNLQDQAQTVGAVTMSGGSISANSVTPGSVYAPGYLFNGDTGAVATVRGILSESAAGATLTKTGGGKATLYASPTYTGATSVQGGQLVAAANFTSSPSISVSNDGKFAISAGTGAVVKTGPISIAGTGKIDLADAKLATSTAVGTYNSGTGKYNGVSGWIQSGRNGAAWNGPGIVTSMTAAGPTSMLTTLAVISNSSFAIPRTSFGGVPVAPTDTLVMYTYAGDANLTGNIDGDDFSAIDAGFAGHLTGYANGDFNYDGKINADDYWLIDRNYSRQGAAFSISAPVGGLTAVPEPGSPSLLLLAASALLQRRRR